MDDNEQKKIERQNEKQWRRFATLYTYILLNLHNKIVNFHGLFPVLLFFFFLQFRSIFTVWSPMAVDV